jgi:mono/diheme cytochrome c family protein
MSKLTTARILSIAGLVLLVGAAKPLAAAGQDDVKKGEQVYAAQKCQQCHSIAGKGKKQNPLDGVAKKAESKKKPPMQNKYSKLPAADIDALVAYMASLK